MTGFNQIFESHWLSRIDEYRHTPRVVFGIGAVNKLGEIAKEVAKNTSALIITDKALEKIGVIEGPKKSLEDAGFTIDVYGSEAKEPAVGEIKKAIGIVKGKDYGLVVGIGGGAAMDTAKAGAVMSETPGEVEEYLCPSTKPLTGTKPKILIPTTSGTGSECNVFAVVIAPEKRMGSMKTWIAGNLVMADAAVVDPSLTIGLPPRITAGSGMDAMSHTGEGVLSLQANPFSDALALKAIELISQNLRTAYHHGNNIEARWNMSLAASIGGTVIGYDWVAGPAMLGHCASEGLAAKYNIPHGEACGVLLPFVYWFNLPDTYARKKLARIAKAMGEDVTGLSAKAAAEKAITATFDLLEDIGLPTDLRHYDVPEKDIPSISEYMLGRAEELYAMSQYSPRKLDLENLKEFFGKVIEGRGSINL
ncbi:MAG: iron-containing alcohol dehydrogenase [Dehalococcoidales bacterium]